MKPSREDAALWSAVTATVRPLPGRIAPPAPSRPPIASAARKLTAAAVRPGNRQVPPPPSGIEPNRFRRIVAGRERLESRLDLHGMDQASAHAALGAFIGEAQQRGVRGVLIITGKGTLGDGVLRRHVPDWLGLAPLREKVAGISEAHRRHGGGGALYVVLKRRSR